MGKKDAGGASPLSPGATPVSQTEFKFKILLLGDSAVGKTCVINRVIRGKDASLSTLSTVGVDLQVVKRKVGAHSVVLQTWDTAGQEKYRSLAESFFRGADGAIVCYDLTRRTSFLSVKQWLSSLAKHVDACDVVLVGNKLDLANPASAGAAGAGAGAEATATREVSTAAGEAAAEELQAAFFETSAATGENVEAAFDALAKALIARRVAKAAASSSSSSSTEKGGRGVGEKRPSSTLTSVGSATAWKSKTEGVDLVDLAARPIQEEGEGGCKC